MLAGANVIRAIMQLAGYLIICSVVSLTASAQTLEQRLLAEPVSDLITSILQDGDARRGAVVFHQVFAGCSKCHSVSSDPGQQSLGPNLATVGEREPVTDQHLIESVLQPSRLIRKGFETLTVAKTDGTVVTGLKVKHTDSEVVLRDASTTRLVTVLGNDIDEVISGTQSIMPAGVVNNLAGRQQFLDLLKYLVEIRDGGASRAAELQPPAALVAFKLPEYESHVDHAGLVGGLDRDAFERGEAIYSRLCINCHGTLDASGSLPTALRFGTGKFKNGRDPFAMYQTLTHGFGLMVPQTWMVPQQKYDVIHYVRESILKQHNTSQYSDISDAYLADLPKGDTFGPKPVKFSPWSDMNYGPWMTGTFEVGRDGSNIAYKGMAVRLDPGPGGVSQGNQWLVFDHDTMRVAGAWTHDPRGSTRFIDWQGIHFDGRHQAHPHAAGEVLFANPTGPGWADPSTGSFADDLRVEGRDGKRYGPLPKQWSTYRGMHHAGDSVVVSYTVGDMNVLESFSTLPQETVPIVLRRLHIGPTNSEQALLVSTSDKADPVLVPIDDTAFVFGTRPTDVEGPSAAVAVRGTLDGTSWLQTDDASAFDMATHDFTLTARIRTTEDGVIFCNTEPGDKWVPNGTVLFIRGGRLCYDIGWVGAIPSKTRVDDGKWHDVALRWTSSNGEVRLYVDGKQDASGRLAPHKRLQESVVRIGYGAPNFPNRTAFRGMISDVRFYARALPEAELSGDPVDQASIVVHWLPSTQTATAGPYPLSLKTNAAATLETSSQVLTGITGDTDGLQFEQQAERLCLTISPSRQSRSITLWFAQLTDDGPAESTDSTEDYATRIADRVAKADRTQVSLDELVQQPARPLWPEILTTEASLGATDASGFAIDTLTAPDQNPWLARLRFGGHDFFADGNRMIVCTWDGDAFEVSGLAGLDSGDQQPKLTWRRIASGLFQPLGVKIVDEAVYLTCRDQLVILRDINSDGATDFYECFNNDHQVTEHFHEFAMGLQRADNGDFYYAKSARHALTAIVPHHGTLLRVSPDGQRTDIVAVGFRAANGVCLNPDGSFIVTDQEGHWNPKNRINWVTEGGFYGNMFGYHDITDESDEAMQQPLCWITNAFDRSPAELLWVDSRRWGNLNGTLLNLSYGYGKLYTVPFEHLKGTGNVQGGMCAFPIAQFPTGTMRGRFHPVDGQLYLSGLFAWGSNQQARDGGLYRVRYDGSAAVMPVSSHVEDKTLSVTFSDAIDPGTVADVKRYAFKVWALERSKNYGSKHIDEHEVEIASARLSDDGRTLTLTIPRLSPTWCYELRCRLQTADGRPVERIIHGTIHEL
jgi:putative heme-binding domain-containing protein